MKWYPVIFILILANIFSLLRLVRSYLKAIILVLIFFSFLITKEVPLAIFFHKALTVSELKSPIN